jgi:DNA-binding transcriptional MerR regulator/methylmalonyl-CoA mutase cobalamin-binding subunit
VEGRGGGYAVGAVVRLTGLSEHVLRAWERRYGAISPRRTPGGTRRYSEADVERIKILQAAVEAGHTISELAPLPNEEIERRIWAARPPEASPIDAIFEAAQRMDGAELERLLTMHFGALGPAVFAREIALPLLSRIGMAWEQGELSVAAEHLTSAQLRTVLGAALRSSALATARPPILFATPSGERHEFGLLVAALVAVGAGARVVYLGTDLPAEEVAGAASELGAAAVALSFVALDPASSQAYLRDLRERLAPAVGLWLGGAGCDGLDLPQGCERIEQVQELERRVARLP